MKRGWFATAGVALTTAALLLAGGCAYTSVQSAEEIPAPGPAVNTGLAAVMPQVVDKRSWPGEHSDEPIPNIRLFAPQITEKLKADLLKNGLFSALPSPESPQTEELTSRLAVTVNTFRWEKEGTNAWVVPHLIVDGVALPFFAVTALVSEGRVDMGGYLIPSSKVGTTLRATVNWNETGFKQPVLSRSYLIEVPLGSVSERQIMNSVYDLSDYGVEMGKREGGLALAKLAEAMSTDPRWAYLLDYRRLVSAEDEVNAQKPLAAKIEAVGEVLDLVKPLTYAPDVAKVLRDGSLDADMRASIVDDIRARRLGLEDASQLPPDLRLDAEQAQARFDDPAVERDMVQAEIDQRVLAMAVKAITPPEEPVAEPEVPPAPLERGPVDGRIREVFTPPTVNVDSGQPNPLTEAQKTAAVPEAEPADAPALRDALARKLAEAVKDKPLVQELLLAEADKAVGPAWPAMEALLTMVDSKATRRYLAERTSS